MDSFIKNMSVNPYLDPDRIINAVEIDVNKEELKEYKIRPLADEAILYEGYCDLPNDRTKMVQMVADLKRDEEGNPIINKKTGRPQGIELRKRTEDEIKENPDKYIPSEDFINYVNEQKRQFGFAQGDGTIAKLYNNISNIMAGGKFEYNEVVRSTKKNFITIIKEFAMKFKNRNKPRLPEGNTDRNYKKDNIRERNDIKVNEEVLKEIEQKRIECLENQNINTDNKEFEGRED